MEDSNTIIKEIKFCLDKCNMLEDVTNILIESTQKRLLTAGAMTDMIIEQYINTVKTLQILDPQGYYFEKVITPIKKYLFKRPDVLRCIISLWIDDLENQNNSRNGPVRIPTFEEHAMDLSSDDDEEAAERWEVQNIIGGRNSRRMRYKQSDLMVMLIDL